ncbi:MULTISPECIES: ABC transporter permease [Bacteroides]|uniref:ABC transporter permease n=1 Tax=Bacteroides TaxID=816 RepID=UPI000E43B84D|nr:MULTISPECIES: FtsX-like permease family protein [Bacteroides]RGM45231.1 ABC transporter permease [Bacteroides sp. OM08-11]
MTKKLFTQIKNEWRSNTWLALELLVVSVVMWYIVDYIYTQAATAMEPRGFDIEHCYLINMGRLTDKSPDYIPNQSVEEQQEDIQEMLDRLKHRPDVEAVSLSQNSYPYNGSNSTAEVQYDTLRSPNWTIRSLVTPDFVRVFRYRGTRGETPEQLAVMLEKDDQFLASDNLFRKYNVPLTSLVGKRFNLFGDTTNTVKLAAAIQNVRYSDYQQARYSYRMLYKMPSTWMDYSKEWCVRVRADQDHDFIERLKADSERLYRVGNIFIAEVRSFTEIRDDFQRSWKNGLRNYMTGMGFLLLNIFLGLLGTFWFRTQQRRSEIALHKAHGATDISIFKRLLCEGWLLLVLVTPLALVIDYNLASLELNSWRNGTTLEWGRLLLCAVITFVLIALMITIGIGIPARKAMKVQPAEALHDE